jgi:hypothetical protein
MEGNCNHTTIIDGEARRHASERLAPVFAAENEAMEPAQREKFTGVISRVLTHAPLIVIVVSRTSGGAHPSLGAGSFSGAVCMNLLHAARALGFAGPG